MVSDTEPIPVKDALRLCEMAIEDCDKATPGEWPSRPIMRVQAGTIAEFPPPSKTGLFALMDNVNFVVLSRAVMRPLIEAFRIPLAKLNPTWVVGHTADMYPPLAALRDHYDRVRPRQSKSAEKFQQKLRNIMPFPSSCSLSHPEIRYTGEKCPLCEALAEVAALRRDFVDECPCPQCPNRTEERSQAAGVYSGLSELCEIEEQGQKEPARHSSAPGDGESK